MRLLTAIPITPGGLGIVELGLTGTLVGFGGARDEVVAAVLLYRALTFLPPLPLGLLAATDLPPRPSRRAGRRRGERLIVAVTTLPPPEPVVSRRVMFFYVLLAVGLIPQIAILAVTLPDRAVVSHWTLAWGGFAIFVALGLLATAVCVVRNSPWTVVAASATGIIVFVDAWFDLMTRQGADDLGPPVVRVLLLKLPLGVLCMVATVAVLRRLSAGRDLIGAGRARLVRRRVRLLHAPRWQGTWTPSAWPRPPALPRDRAAWSSRRSSPPGSCASTWSRPCSRCSR